VGTLAEEFAAMPRSRGRATKRAKTEKGAKETASSPSDAASAGGNGGGDGGVHSSSKITEVRSISFVFVSITYTPPSCRLFPRIALPLIGALLHFTIHCLASGRGLAISLTQPIL
jgi:hypothetical protein